MELSRAAESSTEMRKSKESSVKEPWNFKAHCKLHKREYFEASFMSDFPELEMFVLNCEFTKPNSVDYVYNNKEYPENNWKCK